MLGAKPALAHAKNAAYPEFVSVIGSTGTHSTASESMTKSSIKMKTSSIFVSRSHHNSYRERRAYAVRMIL